MGSVFYVVFSPGCSQTALCPYCQLEPNIASRHGGLSRQLDHGEWNGASQFMDCDTLYISLLFLCKYMIWCMYIHIYIYNYIMLTHVYIYIHNYIMYISNYVVGSKHLIITKAKVFTLCLCRGDRRARWLSLMPFQTWKDASEQQATDEKLAVRSAHKYIVRTNTINTYI